MKYCFLLFFTVVSVSLYSQYNIQFELDNYENDTVIVGNYYADKQLVHDTLYTTEIGKFALEGEDTLNSGVYFLLTLPSRNHIQFFVNGIDNEFKVKWDVSKPTNFKVEGSKDNEAFLRYVEFLGTQRPKADALNSRIQFADSTGVEDNKAEEELAQIEERVTSYQLKTMEEMPNSITAKFIAAGRNPDMPEFEEGKDGQLAKYLYLKEHYFDNIDLGDPTNLRTPYLHNRVKYYMDNLTPKDPDSVIVSVDYILKEMEPSPDTYKYYLSYFLNQYAQMKLVGFDKVYVHLVDNYYAKGKADWISAENLAKLKEQADNLRNILIGEKFPDITTYKKDSSAVRIWDVESPYTVVVFWAHDCGHCTKSMPDIISFYDEFESQGVTLITICTKGGKKTKDCQDAIPKKKMEKFINTFDEYQRYRRKVHIRSTPKIFILDENKEILIKDIPSKELKNIMPEIMKMNAPDKKS